MENLDGENNMKVKTKERYYPICRKDVEIVERVKPSINEDTWISIISCPFCSYLFNKEIHKGEI